MKTPKQLFLEDKELLNAVDQMVKSPVFTKLAHIAFSEYCMGLSGTDNPAKSWDANNRRQGAKDVLELMFSLTEPYNKPTPQKIESLRY